MGSALNTSAVGTFALAKSACVPERSTPTASCERAISTSAGTPFPPQVENSDAWRDTGQDVAEKSEAWPRFSRLLKCRILVRHSVVTGGHDPSPLIHPIAVTPRRPSAYVPAPLNESKGLSLLIRRRSERLHLSPRRGSCPTQNDNSREFVALELSADG